MTEAELVRQWVRRQPARHLQEEEQRILGALSRPDTQQRARWERRLEMVRHELQRRGAAGQ